MSEPRGAPSAAEAHIPRGGMGSPWNRSDGADGALLPCDERRCSPFPLGALVPVTAVCLGLFAVGVSGNVVTVLLIGRYRDMRTTTNLYLGSMAGSDLLILLGLPLDLYRLWRSRPWVFGQLLCRLSLYAGEGCTYATLLHDPDVSAALDPNGTAQLALPRLALPLGASRPPPLPPQSGPEAARFSRKCQQSPAQLSTLRIMLWVTTAYFFLPLLCLSGLIGQELWSSRGPLRGPAASGREKGHRQTVRVLLVVVLAFIVCWLPFHVGRIIYINTEDSQMMHFSQYFNVVALQLF
ncbi:Motilin Receptor [Manis pentadactyla]|nr:Motilin Receptor [Manis pentadactyla]